LQQIELTITAIATMAAAVNATVNYTVACNPFNQTELTWLSGTRGVAGALCLILTLLVLILFACIKPAKASIKKNVLLQLHWDTYKV